MVTSLSGAALRDILQTLARRFAALEVLVFPTRVQGVGAAQEIAASVTRMNRHAAALGGIDVAIVGRGGGSLEDLWAFNEEVVARAVVQSAIPIVSAVGHEIDVSICDLVADLRAATPTAAAEMIVPNQAQLISELQRQAGRAGRAARYSFERATTRLQQRTIREPLARPLQRLNERAQLLDDALLRMQRANQEQTRAQRERLVRVETALLRFAAGARFVQLARRAERSGRRLREALFELLRGLERQIARRLATLQRSAPAVRLGRVQEHQLQSLTRLRLAFGRLLAQRREALATRLAAVQACDPRRVLARGYSITRELRSGRVLRSLKDVREAQRIEVELADGRFRATADDPRQPSLFDTLRSD